MEAFREFVKHVIFEGGLFTDSKYNWLEALFFIILGVWVLGFGALNIFYKISDKIHSKPVKPNNEQERLAQSAVKHQQRKKALLVAFPAALIFIVSVVLLLYAMEVVGSVSDPQLYFNISFALFVISFVYGAVLFFKYGDLEGVGAALSQHVDYLPPHYVTETTYEKWDYEPDSAYRAVGENTYDANEGTNMARAAENVVLKILGVVFVLFNVLWFLIKATVKSVYLLFALPVGSGSMKKLERDCSEEIDRIAEGTDGVTKLRYNCVVSEPHTSGPLNAIDTVKYGQFQYRFARSAEGLNKGAAPLQIVTYGVHGGEVMYFQAEKKICEWREGELRFFVYESARGRLFVMRNERIKLTEKASLLSYFYPFQNNSEWANDLTVSRDSHGLYDGVESTKMLQYHYFRFMKSKCSGEKVVRVAAFVKDNNVIMPKMVSVALKDVTLDDNAKTYSMVNFRS